MKGLVFRGLISMVEEEFGLEAADHMLTHPDLSTKGVFTGVGTYPYSDLVLMLVRLNETTSIPIPDLINAFGKYFYGHIKKHYGHFIVKEKGMFSFVRSIDQYIHVEVQKLYPKAELPKFDILEDTDNYMLLQYSSKRRMGDLAHGLLEACAEDFGIKLSIEREKIEADGSIENFSLRIVE